MRTYTYGYANGISTAANAAHLRDLPVSQSISQNGATITPSTESYDTSSLATLGVVPNEYKPSFNASPSQQTRGNLTQSVAGGVTTNYTYDTAGRIKTATSVDGAVTTYGYTSAAPFTQTATVTTSNNAQGRFTTTTFDGFGRARSVVGTDAHGTQQSEVDTTYAASSNAPLGLKTAGTLPYKPGAAVYNTATAYDGAGNPLKNILPDGSTTTYYYSGNNTTTGDPAGNWKTVTTDVFGNTTALTEPDPNSKSATYVTSYTYDWVNHLTSVSMGTRDGQQQAPCGGYARTFTYSSTTLQLTSKCEPETGTTSYTYNADGTVHTKGLGNGKGITYSYDSYGRYTGFTGSSGDSETVGWDSNPLSGFSGYGANTFGRIAYRQQNNCVGLAPFSCVEVYNYTQSGHMTAEELTAYNTSGFAVSPQLNASFTYDNEGRMTGITYPALSGSSPVTYSYSFDALGRPTGMSTLASAGAYNAAGQLTSLGYLGGTETRSYNSLNQLTGVQLGSSVNTSYLYNAGYNNGQIATLQDSAHGQNVAYSYDSLKRLSGAYYTNVNLLDPGFEQTSVNGWTVAGDANWTDVQFRSWPYSMSVSGGSAAASGVCISNATYTASGYYMSPSGAPATVTTTGAASTTQTLGSASSWTTFSFTFAGPANCAGGVSMTLGGGEADGAVYFDDVSLTSPSVSSGANEISNPGFTNLTIAWGSWGGGPLLTQTTVHSGKTSLLTPAGAWLGQTITGLQPNYIYTVSAYLSGGQGTLTVGSGSSTVTASSGWTQVSASGQASAGGTLAIQATISGSATVYWDDFSMNTQGASQGQQFGYDGFGNLLSQTPIGGSAPMMSLTVNPNTNQVTGTGVVFDGAGNMTQDGGVTYAYDEMNRLTGTGTVSYSYSPGENKRMVVYNNGATPTLTMYLYGPNGKLLSNFAYQKSGSSWVPWPGVQTNYFYLGGKALNWAENNIGSNATATFWPYGQTNTGSGVFGTYWGDASGFLYADQRYYNSGWGRFVTADPSNANVKVSGSISWNRFAYTNGDPVNRVDPRGLTVCDVNGDNCYDSVDVDAGSDETDDVGFDGIGFTGNWSYFWQPGFSSSTSYPSDLAKTIVCRVPLLPSSQAAQVIAQNITTAQQEQTYYNSTSAGEAGFFAWLAAQFIPGGAWDYKSGMVNPTPTQSQQAKIFGNYDFGAVLAGLGFTEYQTQNAAGVAQIGICATPGGACGSGVPLFQFPFGDQPEDQFEVERGWAHEQDVLSGLCPQ